ncbi:MAG: GIY-YIG nuclease family protein [Maribacter sp.]|nr:GIY-YIG nuclease family protein [Maribacter sp.]
MNTYHVYILKCADNSFYTGITGNFDQRWIQHQQGYFKNCYTYKRRPLKIEYILEFKDVIQAILFEKKIKGWTRAKKEAIITANFDKIQLLSECRNFTHSKFRPNIIP